MGQIVRGEVETDDIVSVYKAVCLPDRRQEYLNRPLKGPGRVIETTGYASEAEELVVADKTCLVTVLRRHS